MGKDQESLRPHETPRSKDKNFQSNKNTPKDQQTLRPHETLRVKVEDFQSNKNQHEPRRVNRNDGYSVPTINKMLRSSHTRLSPIEETMMGTIESSKQKSEYMNEV